MILSDLPDRPTLSNDRTCTQPNPRVWYIIELDQQILGKGGHKKHGGKHDPRDGLSPRRKKELCFRPSGASRSVRVAAMPAATKGTGHDRMFQGPKLSC